MRGRRAELDRTPASRAELKALDEMEREGHWTVAGHEVRVTNLDKVLIPAEGDHAPSPSATCCATT